MFQPYPLFIGLRYTRSKRRNHFVSFITIASVLGIALGATVLITVLSVMNGFEQELRSRILGMTSHATVTTFSEQVPEWRQVQEQSLEHPRVVAAAPYVQGEGMLRAGKQFSGGLLRGVEPGQEITVSDIGEHMKQGRFDELRPGEYNIILGVYLAQILGVSPGDKVDVMIPQASVTAAGVLPRFRRFTVSGVFEVDMYEYDRSVAMMHRTDLARLYRMGDSASGVRLKLDDLYAAPLVAKELRQQLNGIYLVDDWTQRHKNFFQAIATEKVVMFFILLLIIAVAAFNIASAMVMVVTEKQSDIAILRTLGASPNAIMVVFMVQGIVIGLVGTILGVLGGITIASNVDVIVPWIEGLVGRDLFGGETYVISSLRGEINPADVMRTAFAAFGLSILSTLYPAWRAAKVQPAEALRYE